MNGIKNFRIKGNNKEVRQQIKDLCEQIVRVVAPQQIILFGSYAYGQPTEDSDVDLLVIMPFEGHPAYQATRIRMQVATPLAVDLLVRTPEYVATRIAMEDFFMHEVMAEGKVLYEADHAGVAGQSGRRLGQRAA